MIRTISTRFLSAEVLKVVAPVAVVLALSSCGGGGGGGGDDGGGASISVQPRSFVFEAERGAETPIDQPIRFTVRGDEVSAETAPGALDVDWGEAILEFTSDTILEGFIRVRPFGEPRGTQQTTVRFTAFTSSSSAFVDVPISLTVLEPFSFTPLTPVVITEIDGDPAGPVVSSPQRQVLGDRINWRLQSNVPWLTPTPGSGTGDALISLVASRGNLSFGTATGSLQLTETRTGTNRAIDASYALRAAQLVVTPASGAITVTPDTLPEALAATVSVGSELPNLDPAKAVTWSVADETQGRPADWASLTPTSAPSVPVIPFRVEVIPEQLRLLDFGGHPGQFVFRYTDTAGIAQSRTLSMNLSNQLPMIRGAWPRVVSPSAQSRVVTSFDTATIDLVQSRVRVGSEAPLNVDASQAEFQIGTAALTLPGLAAGEYPIQVPNALALDRSFADLLVRAPVTLGASSIESPGVKSRLIHDPIRDALYAVDSIGGQVLRYRMVSGVWVPDAPLPLSGLRDASLAVSGNTLMAVANNMLYRASLADAVGTFESLGPARRDECGVAASVSSLLSARTSIFITGAGNCGPFFGTARVWDEIRQEYETEYGGARGGDSQVPAETSPSRIYSFYAGLGPGPTVWVDNARGEVSTFISTPLRNAPPIFALSGADTRDLRILVNDELLISDDFDPLGQVPRGDAAIVNADGTRVYVFVGDAPGGAVVNIHDASTDPVGGLYPQIGTVPVAVDIGLPTTTDRTLRRAVIAIRLADDGKTLFLSGSNRIAVVPLP